MVCLTFSDRLQLCTLGSAVTIESYNPRRSFVGRKKRYRPSLAETKTNQLRLQFRILAVLFRMVLEVKIGQAVPPRGGPRPSDNVRDATHDTSS